MDEQENLLDGLPQAATRGQILRSSSIIGGASVSNIVVGLGRMKVAALVLGPVGVGLIGLLQNILQVASTIASLGFGTIGTRQIAEAFATGKSHDLAVARRALVLGTFLLAALGGMVVWLLRGWVSAIAASGIAMASDIGWLAIGVAFSVIAGSQVALLTGLRRIGAVAAVSVGSAILSSLFGIVALLAWGEKAIIPFVLATPVASVVMGYFYLVKIPSQNRSHVAMPQLFRQWATMARLGLAFTVAGGATTIGQLAARSLISDRLGAAALGQYQAAWLISITYLGFVLQAMTTDYYPRLTAALKNADEANRVVNEQTEIAVLLSGPVLLGMMALCPWVLALLYSDHFAVAALVLRWQIIGDALKVASWPLGYLLLASGDGRTYALVETTAIVVLVAAVALLLPLLGLTGSGVAVVVMYAIYLPLVWSVGARKTNFKWHRSVMRDFALLCAMLAITFAAATLSPVVGAAIGLGFALVSGVRAVHGLRDALPGRLGAILRRLNRLHMRGRGAV